MNEGAAKRLQILLDGILDATEPDAQRHEFARLVEQNPDLVAPFIEQMRMHSLLQWLCDEVKAGNVQVPAAAVCSLREATRRRPVDRRTFIGWTASLAAILIIGGAATFWWTEIPPEKPAPLDVAVAEVVDEGSVVWSENTTALHPDRMIYPGRLEFEAGELTLRFRSGATVTFRGASSMRIESDMLVRLDRGQATAQVPHWAKGFTIETADVKVVDLGTQFGIMASAENATDVVIFEGEVDVTPTGGAGNVQRRLVQGQAARIDSDGAINRIAEVRGDTKNGWSTITDSGAPISVFASIRDNIPSTGGTDYFYYCQITPGGLQEDALAYVDRRPHQWNGLTVAGLPKFLLGADYCRTFNDYRYISDFEIVVKMARPANLYVFFDDRVSTPDWLLESFENTAVKIGLDEGPDEGIPQHRTAVGPGNSIDNVFTVWRRRCEGGEVVKIGGMENRADARAMYGIAAKALEPTN
jgi:ferric-dicitrate binding protein FerR (iron transport regulator)